MSSGNLELHIGDERHYAFTDQEGYRVHHALQQLIGCTGDDYREWFFAVAPALLMTIGERLTAPDHRAVINATTKRIDVCSHYKFPMPHIKAALQNRGYRVVLHYDEEFFHPTRTEADIFMEQLKARFP